jgi:hypothetical protein
MNGGIVPYSAVARAPGAEQRRQERWDLTAPNTAKSNPCSGADSVPQGPGPCVRLDRSRLLSHSSSDPFSAAGNNQDQAKHRFRRRIPLRVRPSLPTEASSSERAQKGRQTERDA